MTLSLEIPALLDYLKGQNYDAQLQKETNQVYYLLKHEKYEFPVFFRIFEEGGMLQILAFFPAPMKPEAKSDVGRLLHMLNKELDLPGLGMDEEVGAIFYRLMVPTFKKTLNLQLLDAYLKGIKTVCESFAPAVVTVSQGLETFDSVLEKAKQMQQKGS